MSDKDTLIQRLDLQPHPEGGFYKETYRAEMNLDTPPGFSGNRSASTGIYFMLTKDSKSHLHRIKSDEMWHFYSGDPLQIVMLSPTGEFSEKILGPNLDKGETYQFVVPAGYWFGSEVLTGGEYSLVGCTVAPGFDFNDFEMAKKEELIKTFPKYSEFLNEFCLD